MTTQPRPRRSVLFMPGSNARALAKARLLPADSLIFDLEDAVAPDAKALARDQVQRALAEGGYGAREVVVRVNGLDTQWVAEDIKVMARTSADALLFPKVEAPDQVLEAIETMDSAGARPGMPVWIMAETPRGVLGIDAAAGASSRLRVIVMGTSDLGKELRVRYTADRAGLSTALSLCVLAARSHGLEILDGVHPNLTDTEGFERSCQTGRELGFDGKTLIHPAQIETANRVFGPDQDELTLARRIVDAWAQASKERRGVVVVDGRMIENLHVEEARRSLALAAAIEALNTP